MGKRNCWEIKACGLGPRPAGTPPSRPICPAAVPGVFDGINGGRFRGRFCWAVPGTLCHGQVQESVIEKLEPCLACDVMLEVGKEEGSKLTVIAPWRRRVDDFA